MKNNTLPTLRGALKYCKEHGLKLGEIPGYVIFFGRKACGWALQPRTTDWRPGCVMVDLQTGAQFEAVGGTYMAGCERWNQLSHTS